MITTHEARKLAAQIHAFGLWEEFGLVAEDGRNYMVIPSRSGLAVEVRALADALQVGLESAWGLEEQINSYFAYAETKDSAILLTCYQLQTFQRNWEREGDPWELTYGEDDELWELVYWEVFGEQG